jgi:hypothetical protein
MGGDDAGPLDECSTGDKIVRFSNAQGAQGSEGRKGDASAPGAPGMSKSFWSGVTGVTTAVARDEVVTLSLAATGPIAPSWWTITGELTLGESGDVFVGCNLLASNGAQLASVYTTAPIGAPVSIPIRALVDQMARVFSLERVQGLASFAPLIHSHAGSQNVPRCRSRPRRAASVSHWARVTAPRFPA